MACWSLDSGPLNKICHPTTTHDSPRLPAVVPPVDRSSLSPPPPPPPPPPLHAMIISAAAAAPLLRRPLSHPPPIAGLRVLGWTGSKAFKSCSFQGVKPVSIGCSAELQQDAPFAAAIAASILNSVVFPVPPGGEEEDGGGAINSTDTRFAVMAIIGFIPYFNWMSWVFAWLDSRRTRYLVYAVVYLAPYLRTNLSLSPEESWLPIASILFCIIHIQIEASIMSGDLNDIKFLNEVRKLFAQLIGKKEGQFEGNRGFPKKGRSKEHELPSAQESRDKFQQRIDPRYPVDDLHNEQPDKDAKENKAD